MVGFLCNECGKSFAEDIDLALHERRTHDKRTFPCEKCGETLVGQSKYKFFTNFLTKISLFDPTFTFWGQKIPTFFVCWKV